MGQTLTHSNGTGHLRVVFAEAVMWFDLRRNATFLDVSRILTPARRRRYGEPLDVRVVLGRVPTHLHAFVNMSATRG